MHRGFIKIWRCLEDWEWVDDVTTVGFFVKFIMMANWEDKRWHGVVIKRGSFVSSIAHLSEQFGLSAQRIRTLLYRLKSTGELTIEATNKYSIYVVVNYDKYQNRELELTSEVTSHPTNEQQTSNKRLTTTKELKELKNNNNKPESEVSLSADNRLWTGITQTHKSDWAKAYPAVDVDIELAKMATYMQANPHKRKKNWLRFINGWLNRCQDNGGTKGYKKSSQGPDLNNVKWVKPNYEEEKNEKDKLHDDTF